jgi:hypothetical protein
MSWALVRAVCVRSAVALPAAGNGLIRLRWLISKNSHVSVWAVVLSRLRSGLSTHLGCLSFEGQGAFAS